MMGLRQVADRLAIIGLDACDWNYLDAHLDALPWFQRMVADEEGGAFGGRLESDVRPILSGPAWAQVFAGTTFGLEDFARDEKRKEIIADPRWLWAGHEQSAMVAGVPAALPPIDVNCDGRGWIEATLSVTEAEMERATWMRARQLAPALMASGIILAVVIFPALDRAGHIFGMDDPRTLRQYQVVDQAMASLYGRLEPLHWLIVSDHGMTSDETYYDPSWFVKYFDGRKGRHTPDGVILTNMRNPPDKLSQVYSWLMEADR